MTEEVCDSSCSLLCRSSFRFNLSPHRVFFSGCVEILLFKTHAGTKKRKSGKGKKVNGGVMDSTDESCSQATPANDGEFRGDFVYLSATV